MRDLLPALELFAKAVRSGLSVVRALVDCGIPRQHAGAQWLEAFEEENEVLEVPLSADFDDDEVSDYYVGAVMAYRVQCVHCDNHLTGLQPTYERAVQALEEKGACCRTCQWGVS